MKKKFSTAWKASKQPRKQRKYIAKAPLHIKMKFMSANLSKELRKKQNKRNLPLKKGDVVKIMRGSFKKKQGKVTRINSRFQKVYIEGIQTKKRDGSKVNVPLKASNLQIIELASRESKKKKNKKETKKEEKKKEQGEKNVS